MLKMFSRRMKAGLERSIPSHQSEGAFGSQERLERLERNARTVVVALPERIEDGEKGTEAEDRNVRPIDLRRKNGGFGGEADYSASEVQRGQQVEAAVVRSVVTKAFDLLEDLLHVVRVAAGGQHWSLRANKGTHRSSSSRPQWIRRIRSLTSKLNLACTRS